MKALGRRYARRDISPTVLACCSRVVSRVASAFATDRPNAVILYTAPLIVLVRTLPVVEFNDETLVEHAPDRAIERARAQLERAVRSRRDVLHDGVTMAILVRDGDQDVKHRNRQRQQALGIGR